MHGVCAFIRDEDEGLRNLELSIFELCLFMSVGQYVDQSYTSFSNLAWDYY